jgi:hypothetical protein
MSSAEFTVLFLPVSVAQYHPFCLTVSPESSAPQTRHSDISRPGGVQLLQPRLSAWGIISFQLSIRGAGHKFDRPLGGNSRLQQEILQLKNEELTAVVSARAASHNRQLAEPNFHRPPRNKVVGKDGRLEFDSSRGPPLTSALSDEDEREQDSSLDNCGAQSGPGPVQNLCVRCLDRTRKALGMGTRSDHGVLLVLARCRALQVRGPAARQRAGDPTPATFGELEAPAHTRAATGGPVGLCQTRRKCPAGSITRKNSTDPRLCASPLCVNGGLERRDAPLSLLPVLAHHLPPKMEPKWKCKAGETTRFPSRSPHTSGLSL